MKKTFFRFISSLEAGFLLLTSLILLLAAVGFFHFWKTEILTSRSHDAKRVRDITIDFLQQEQKVFQLYASMLDHDSRELLINFLPSFENLYHLDNDWKITSLSKSSDKARVFPGFSFSTSFQHDLFHDLSTNGFAISSVMRSVEDGQGCIYIIQKIVSGYVMGRINLQALSNYASYLAEYTDSIVLFVSQDSFIMASTSEKLYAMTYLDSTSNVFHFADQRWSISRSRVDLVQADIVVLSPMTVFDRIQLLLFLIFPIVIVALVLLSWIKLYTLRRRLLLPLETLVNSIRNWNLTPEEVEEVENTQKHAFFETQILLDTFTQKSREINTAVSIIQTQKHQLYVLNKNLESEVEKRTQELMEAREQLLLSEKMSLIGQLASEMSHELNSPLAVILSVTRSLQKQIHSLHIDTETSPALDEDAEASTVIEKTLIRLVHKQFHANAFLDTKRKMLLTKKLKKAGLPNSRKIATELFDLALPNLDSELLHQLCLVKSPLTLLEQVSQKTTAFRSLILIQAAAQQAVTTITMLSANSYSHTEQAGIHNIQETMEEALSLLENQMSADISFELHFCDTLHASFRRQELIKVWYNLIDNAVAAIDGKGSIRISIEEQEREAVIKICDSGSGVPKELQKRLFEPFHSQKVANTGVGLGLFFCKQALKLAKGSIVYTFTKEGSCFTIRLPKTLKP